MGHKLHLALEKANKKYDEATAVVIALEMIKTGSIPEKLRAKTPDVAVAEETALQAAPGTNLTGIHKQWFVYCTA